MLSAESIRGFMTEFNDNIELLLGERFVHPFITAGRYTRIKIVTV